jgi:hypothetical protein
VEPVPTSAILLGESDMAAFKRKWEKFVLGLRNN